LREEIVNAVREARAQGTSLRSCADRLGISAETLRRWTSSSFTRPSLVPVAVVKDDDRKRSTTDGTAGSQLVLALPGGAELRGLTIEDAISIVRRLS